MTEPLRNKYKNVSDYFEELHKASERVQEQTLIQREESQREKRLKKWNRDWKNQLISEHNPRWVDLYPSLIR